MTNAPWKNPNVPYEHRMRVWEAQQLWMLQTFQTHTHIIGVFAELGIKSVILANSAAAGAVLVFLGSVWGTPTAQIMAEPALRSITVFSIGIFLAIAAAAASYFTQFCYATHDIHSTPSFNAEYDTHRGGEKSPAQEESTEERKGTGKARTPKGIYITIGMILHVTAVLCALSALGSFGIGAWLGLDALGSANGGVTP